MSFHPASNGLIPLREKQPHPLPADVILGAKALVKAMSKKNGVSGALRRQVMREGAYTCAGCAIKGREVRFPRGGFGFPTDTPGVHLSIDHIKARARGGTSEPSNLRILCVPCNTRKGTRDA